MNGGAASSAAGAGYGREAGHPWIQICTWNSCQYDGQEGRGTVPPPTHIQFAWKAGRVADWVAGWAPPPSQTPRPPSLQQLRPNPHHNRICPPPMSQIGGRLAGIGQSHVDQVAGNRRWKLSQRPAPDHFKQKLDWHFIAKKGNIEEFQARRDIDLSPPPSDTSGSAPRLLAVSCPLLPRPLPISRPAACPPCRGKRSFLKDSLFGEQRCSSPPLWLPRTGVEGTDEGGRNYLRTYVARRVRVRVRGE